MKRKTKIEIGIIVVIIMILIGYAFLFMESAEYYSTKPCAHDHNETPISSGHGGDTPIEEFCADHCKMCYGDTSCDLECFVDNCTHRE